MVRGGVLSRDGGQVSWMPGHRIRMGMARAVGDFDADGKPEVAVGRLYGDQKGEPGDLRVLQDDGSSEVIDTLRGVRALSAADLNGDGHAELLFGDGWHINYGKLARYRPQHRAAISAGLARRFDRGERRAVCRRENCFRGWCSDCRWQHACPNLWCVRCQLAATFRALAKQLEWRVGGASWTRVGCGRASSQRPLSAASALGHKRTCPLACPVLGLR